MMRRMFPLQILKTVRTTTLTLSLLLGTSIFAEVSASASTVARHVVSSAVTSQSSSTAVSMITAESSGVRVEDIAQRTETSQTFANPNGTWTTEFSPEPQQVVDDAGAWHPIDTTLVERGGELHPRYAASNLSILLGGTKTFARITEDSRDLEWRWPDVLPAPAVDGDTVTYKNVLPHGDLVVTATPTGFEHSVVLNQQPAESIDIKTPIVTDGADMVDSPSGGFSIEKASGEAIVSSPGPLMWDSSLGNEGGPENVAPVESAVKDAGGTSTLTLSPDPEFLADPATVYPVTIDPTISVGTFADTWVQNAGYTTSQVSSNELRAGTYDAGAHVARSFLKFDVGEIVGTRVQSADFVMRNFSSNSCSASTIRVEPIDEAWAISDLTWSNQPAVDSSTYADYSPAKGYNSNCVGGDATWNITSIAKAWANGTVLKQGLRVSALNETSNASWRKYRAGNYGAPTVPKLSITYTSNAPSLPTAVSASPGGPGYVTSLEPDLQARVSDPDGVNVRARFTVLKGSTPVWSGTSEPVTSGSVASVTVPSDVLEPGGQYTFTVAADDGAQISPTSQSVPISVDIAAAVVPAPPCATACSTLSSVKLFDSAQSGLLQGGESRVVDVRIAGIDNDAVQTLLTTVVAKSWASPGALKISNPQYAVPVADTLAFTSGDSPGTGVSTTAEVTPSVDGLLRISNTSPQPVAVTVTANSWVAWTNSEEQSLDDAEALDGSDTTPEGFVEESDDDVQEDAPTEQLTATEKSAMDQAIAPGVGVNIATDYSRQCASSGPDTETCITVLADSAPPPSYGSHKASYAQEASDYETIAARTPTAHSCPSITGKPTSWRVVGRFHACNAQRILFDQRIKQTQELTGQATIKVQQDMLLHAKSLDLQHTYRFYYLSGWGTASDVTLNTWYYCTRNCTSSDEGLRIHGPINYLHSFTGWSNRNGNANPAANALDSVGTFLAVSPCGGDGKCSAIPAGYDSPKIYCDRLDYIVLNGGGSGCRFPDYWPTFNLWLNGQTPESAKHILDSQTIFGHPGAKSDGRPLHRHYWGPNGSQNKNRNEARRLCRALKDKTGSCDEYPFASTDEGCYLLRCHVRKIDLADNVKAGRFLGTFYRDKRIADDGKFWVKIH